MPKLTHPDSDQAIDVHPDQVPMYETQGWRVARSPAKRAAKQTAPPSSTTSTEST